jgi:predicted DCC family thiol-disulfide oxidoreductase YuxK
MKVYYNESCSICRAEINHYKKQNTKEIEWVDITNNIVAEKDTSKDDKALLRRLHVEENGQVFAGAKAFLLVWKKIPKYKFLYTFFRLPIIFNIFTFFYEIIAFFLYQKNKKQIRKN